VGAGSSWADVQRHMSRRAARTYLRLHSMVNLLLSYSEYRESEFNWLKPRCLMTAWGDGGNDLLIAVGQGGKYAGGQGTDTLYADWSNSTQYQPLIDTSDLTQESSSQWWFNGQWH
jgi:hypothetical protein